MARSCIIVSAACIYIKVISIVLAEVCVTDVCNKQAKQLSEWIRHYRAACNEFHELACGDTPAPQSSQGNHLGVQSLVLGSMYLTLLDGKVTAEIKKHPLIQAAFEQFQACANITADWSRCYAKLTTEQRLAAQHFFINQNVSSEAKKRAKLVANGVLNTLKADPKLFAFGEYWSNSTFLTKTLPSMRIEVGYADNFDILEHSDYLMAKEMTKVESSYNLQNKLSPAPFWPVDMIAGNFTYHNESNTIYVPLAFVFRGKFFNAEAPVIYNYAKLGVLIAQFVLREFIGDLKSSGIFSADSSVKQIARAISCVREQLLTVEEYRFKRAYSRDHIVNETMDMIIEEIIIDMMALRAAHEAFSEAEFQDIYNFTGKYEQFSDSVPQFFLLYSQNYCNTERESVITSALTFKGTQKAVDYYKATLPLKNYIRFDEIYNCTSKKMAHIKCIPN